MMVEYDIILEGNSFTTACFAYYISQHFPEQKIAYIYDKKIKVISPFYLPGFVYPILELPSILMEEVFKESNEFLENLKSLRSYFEIIKYPLLLLYRDKRSYERFQEHAKKLEDSTIKNSSYSLIDMQEYYPFLFSDKEIYGIEICDSFSCSDLSQIKDYILRTVQENNVEIIVEDDLVFNDKSNTLEGSLNHYSARLFSILTSVKSSIPKQITNIIKVVTPVFEQFPRMSIVDYSSDIYLWLEEAGYLNLFSYTIENKTEEEFLNLIRTNFQKMIINARELEIVDTEFLTFSTNLDPSEIFRRKMDLNVFEISIPIPMELALAPALACKFAVNATKIMRRKGDEITFKTLFS